MKKQVKLNELPNLINKLAKDNQVITRCVKNGNTGGSYVLVESQSLFTEGKIVDDKTAAKVFKTQVGDSCYQYLLFNTYTSRVIYSKLLQEDIDADEFYENFKSGVYAKKQTYYHGTDK